MVGLFPNLGNRMRSLAGKLSGGEQQMLAAGRALVGNPELLLMDEPTEGLAPLMVRELGRTIAQLKDAGTSILLIEQQLAFALRYADVVFIMSKGRIVHHCRRPSLPPTRRPRRAISAFDWRPARIGRTPPQPSPYRARETSSPFATEFLFDHVESCANITDFPFQSLAWL